LPCFALVLPLFCPCFALVLLPFSRRSSYPLKLMPISLELCAPLRDQILALKAASTFDEARYSQAIAKIDADMGAAIAQEVVACLHSIACLLALLSLASLRLPA
jgi:hypothetical protein